MRAAEGRGNPAGFALEFDDKMARFPLRATALVTGVGLLGGCAQIRDHKGYVVDTALISSVQPGVDNRDSVQKTLGRPSFAGEFDGNKTWYYYARDTRQYAFNRPHPVAQTLLTVTFDPQGNVAAVKKTGLETVVAIGPNGDKTPTLGRKTGFFSALFGNIGRVGAGGVGGTGNSDTPDNPN